MENFGATYKMIRKNKGFTMKEAAAGVVSTQSLAKFEKGETSISVNNLNGLLNNILVSWKELMNFHNGNNLDSLDTFDMKMQPIIYSNDYYRIEKEVNKLLENYEKHGQIKDYHAASLLQFVYYNLIEKETPTEGTESISNYLKQIDQWYQYENYLFASALTRLPEEEVKLYYKRVSKYFKKRKDRGLEDSKLVLELYYLTLSRFLHDRNLEESVKVVNHFEELVDVRNDPTFLFPSIILKHKKGSLRILQGDSEGGAQEIKDCIHALELIGGYQGVINSMDLSQYLGHDL